MTPEGRKLFGQLQHELRVLGIVANDIAMGRLLDQCDRDRIRLAAERIDQIEAALYGRR